MNEVFILFQKLNRIGPINGRFPILSTFSPIIESSIQTKVFVKNLESSIPAISSFPLSKSLSLFQSKKKKVKGKYSREIKFGSELLPTRFPYLATISHDFLGKGKKIRRFLTILQAKGSQQRRTSLTPLTFPLGNGKGTLAKQVRQYEQERISRSYQFFTPTLSRNSISLANWHSRRGFFTTAFSKNFNFLDTLFLTKAIQKNKRKEFLSCDSCLPISCFPCEATKGKGRNKMGCFPCYAREEKREAARGCFARNREGKLNQGEPNSNQKKTAIRQGITFFRFQSSKSGNQTRLDQKNQQLSITYEEIGLFPRSFNRVIDRFFKQIFSDVGVVIDEFRFYRYLFFTTVRCLFLLIVIPVFVHFCSKIFLVRPTVNFYWNSQQTEIFLNSHQQKLAFSELQNFEEKLYFESLITKVDVRQERQKVFFDNNFLENSYPNSFLPYPSFNSSETKPPSLPSFLAVSLAKQPKGTEGKAREIANNATKLEVIQNVSFTTITSHLPGFKAAEGELIKEENASFIAPLSVSFRKDQIQGTRERNNLNTSTTLSLVRKAKSLNEEIIAKQGEKMPTNFSQNPTDINNIEQSKFDSFHRFNQFRESLQKKTTELALHYNEQSIETITNFFADLIGFGTLCFLFFRLSIQINITKSFLLEVFFGLDDSKKSLFILFVTDLSVGYHSPNIWALGFEFFFNHYGIPESETTIFLLVATLPVLLDVLFKYLIFRHLNRASPATVATYHAMIE